MKNILAKLFGATGNNIAEKISGIIDVRPIVLVFLIISTVLMVFIDAGAINFNVDSEWKELLKLLLTTTVAAYFGGRSYEKIKR